MNSINIIGRTTKDIEMFNENMGKISIAVSRPYKNLNGEYETDFFDCVIFNAASEYIKNIKKGTLVSIEGRLQNSSFEKDGRKYTSTNIIVNRIQVLVKPQPKENPYETFGNSIKTESNIGEQIQIDDSELPF